MSNAEHTQLSMSPQQAARATSLSPYTIYTAISAGELKAKKIGSRLVIRVADLSAWVDSHPDAAQD